MRWLYGLLAFGILVVVPFAIQLLVGRTPRWIDDLGLRYALDFFPSLPSFASFILSAAILAVVLGTIFLAVRVEQISDNLRLAEREFNVLLNSLDQTGRKKRAEERVGWAKDLFKDPFTKKGEEVFDLNEKDAVSKGGVGGKAFMTAFLLREVLEGHVELAQQKIWADTQAGGSVPHVVPGLREIIGMDDFDKNTGFAPGAGVRWFPLMLAVRFGGFPRGIIQVKGEGDDKKAIYNWEVIISQTQAVAPSPSA